MKRFLLPLLLLLLACNQNKPVSVKVRDSVAETSDSITSPQQDSFIKTQQEIAFDDLRFGMTQKEVNQSEKKHIYRNINNQYFSLFPHFDHHNKLYSLELLGASKDADLIETEIRDEVDTLEATIEKKYGQPITTSLYPSLIDFKAGKIIWLYEWHVGRKVIFVGTGEQIGKNAFYSVCQINDTSMLAAMNRYYDSKRDTLANDADKF